MFTWPWLSRLLTPDWLTAIGTVGTAVLALLLAASDWIERIFIHPKLELDASVKPPSAQKTVWRSTGGKELGDVWYFRLAITNRGRAVARDVHVFLANVEELKNGKFIPVKRFSPMFLKWAHLGGVTTPTLWPDMPRFCDLAHMTSPDKKQLLNEDLHGVGQLRGVLVLDVEVKPNQQGDLLEAGTYRFELKLAAANYRPRTVTIRVQFDGLWYPDEEEMFKHYEMNSI
jgi:hypothetical protein